ncbi:MAG: hypothetical protein H6Q90_5799 [Deltaproteobacteria bacterium]|nr:hypothetical protein [Deltaproteobacteria bacterium]
MCTLLTSIVLLFAASCSEPTYDLIELTDGQDNARRWSIAFDGTDYAVVWTTSANRPTDDRLWFARVSPAGDFVTAPTAVLEIGDATGELHLVATGTTYVVWFRQDITGTAPVRAVAIDEQGDALAPSVQVGTAYGAPAAISVAWTGSGFAVLGGRLASSQSDQYLSRVSPELVVLGSSIVETSVTTQIEPRLVWSPSDATFVAAWTEGARIRVARLATDGALIAPSEEIAAGADAQAHAIAAADDAGHVMVGWAERTGQRARFATSAGGPWRFHAGLIDDSRYEWLEPAIAVRAERAVVAWSSDADTALTQILVGELALDDGTALEHVRALTPSRSRYRTPRLAAGTAQSGLVFGGTVNGSERLYFTTVE